MGVNRPVLQCLRSRRLEVVGEKENGRARERHARGPSPLGSTSFQGFSPTRPTGRREVSSCQIPGGGDEKRVQMLRPSSTLQHFSLITQSNSAILGILMCDFLFQLTSFFCNSARILIKTSRLDDTSVTGFSTVIKLLTQKLIEHYKVICYVQSVLYCKYERMFFK